MRMDTAGNVVRDNQKVMQRYLPEMSKGISRNEVRHDKTPRFLHM